MAAMDPLTQLAALKAQLAAVEALVCSGGHPCQQASSCCSSQQASSQQQQHAASQRRRQHASPPLKASAAQVLSHPHPCGLPVTAGKLLAPPGSSSTSSTLALSMEQQWLAAAAPTTCSSPVLPDSSTSSRRECGSPGCLLSPVVCASPTFESNSMAEATATIKDPVRQLERLSGQLLGLSTAPHGARNAAIRLEQRLQQELPAAGAMAAAQQQHGAAWARRQQQAWQQQLAAQPELLQVLSQSLQQQQQAQTQEQQHPCMSPQLAVHHQLLDQLMQDVAQQVGHSCVEHGRALQLLRERYSELANALYLAVRNLAQHAAAASDTASHAAAAATAAEAGAAVLDQRLAEQQQADSHLRDELEACRGRLEQAEQDAASDMQVLQQQVLVLRQQLLQVREQLECCQLEAQRATDRARDDAETQAQAAEAAQQALQQRLGFLSAQLAALRQQQRPVPVTAEAACQTEEELTACAPPPANEPPPPAVLPASAEQQLTDEGSAESDQDEDAKCIDLLSLCRGGSVRSKLWVTKVVGQLLADKAVADAVADRQGQGRAGFADFVVAWHFTRYGLPDLALASLRDLMTSSRHHAAHGCPPARWLAALCGVAKPARGSRNAATTDDASKEPQSPQQQQQQLDAAGADFFLHCCLQLAHPASLVALFPEGEDAAPLVRSQAAMEALRAVFRWLRDPDALAAFAAQQLSAAAVDVAGDDVAAGRPAPAGAGDGSSPSSNHVVAFRDYNAWALLDLLLAEWASRARGDGGACAAASKQQQQIAETASCGR